MNFDNEKKVCLEKALKSDRSIAGGIDPQIRPLVDLVNSHPDFYTTSSCAGRIMLFRDNRIKKDSGWLFSSHEKVTFEEIRHNLANLPDGTVWFRMEAPILHLCARDMEKADMFLKMANNSGFRRSSIIGYGKRIILEIFFPDKLDAPVADKGQLLVEEDYLRFLISQANSRLEKSRKRLKKLETLFSSPGQKDNQDQQQ